MKSWVYLCVLTGWLAGCASDVEPRLEVSRAALMGSADSAYGVSGPAQSGLWSSREVWAVHHDWDDVTPEAGLAWGVQSGLSFNEKYAAWVESLVPADGFGPHQTFELSTPYGKSLPAPALECAETAMFLRVAFASWHGLPMFISVHSAQHGGALHFGHFGIAQQSGAPVSGFPAFKSAYADHSDQMGHLAPEALAASWPTDPDLAWRSLSATQDDAVPFLGPDAFAGAYFDAVFLNKRVGQFLMRLLTMVGSMHIVDEAHNSFNVKPKHLRAGDLLMQRWQRIGIGHTVVVVRTNHTGPSAFQPEVVYGSMPRIQPKWKTFSQAETLFLAQKSGGEGVNEEGYQFAELGGGLKRWRTAKLINGVWRNVIPATELTHWINASDLEALAARPAELEALFDGPTPEEEREALLSDLEDARAQLRQRPSSCVRRVVREDVFEALYALNEDWFGVDQEESDRLYRELSDYVFPTLVYGASPTCCWNSTDAAMYDLIMGFNEAHVYDANGHQCQDVMPFMMVDGDYAPFADYAHAQGAGDTWRSWSADEGCPQLGASDDLLAPQIATSLCQISEDVLGLSAPGGGDEDNADSETTTSHDPDLTIVEESAQTGCQASGTSGDDNRSASWVIVAVLIALLMRRRVGTAR